MKVYHPDAEASYDVSKDSVDEWVEAGWLKSEPKKVREASEAEDS